MHTNDANDMFPPQDNENESGSEMGNLIIMETLTQQLQETKEQIRSQVSPHVY